MKKCLLAGFNSSVQLVQCVLGVLIMLSWYAANNTCNNKTGSARGGSGIPVYPKKIRQNTQKYAKFIQIYPKLIEALYTVYLKLVVSEASHIPNTRI